MFIPERQIDGVVFTADTRRLRLRFVTSAIVRVTCTEAEEFQSASSRMVIASGRYADFTIGEEIDRYTLRTEMLLVEVAKESGALTYRTATGRLLTREPERGGKWLTAKAVYRTVFARDEARAFASGTELSVDGARAAAAQVTGQVFARNAYQARLDFVFAEDEALFGLGSHEEGYGNLRGRARELYQQNMKAVVPVLVSTRGWAMLMECGSLMTFHDDALGSYWWMETVDELDFYLVAGDDYDEVSAGLRVLTGPAPLPPKWLFGFAQSKERYVNADELIAVVEEHRRREIPLDLIVLDWKSWPNGDGWGQKSWDPIRFPSPGALTERLHALGARLMVSIWPIMTGGCANQRELLAAGGMLGNQATYNAFSASAREIYWQQAQAGLFAHGVDAWWCDCTEPFEADWAGAVKPEPHLRVELNTAQSKLYLDPGEINLYSLEHSRGIYDGQRASGSQKRVVNLTRSSYAGQHRYGTITWNGDTCATWETLRRSIPEGLNFCATGEPYWTVDAGGFFLAHDPALWFWRGNYPEGTRGLTPGDALAPDPADTGCKDLGFHELYTRWLQYCCFLPMMRSHGTDAAREIWRFGEPGGLFYDAIAETIRFRYRLVPYLYGLAAECTARGTALLRAVALAYPVDTTTHALDNQFLLGPGMMVCPVTRAMYFDPGSTPLRDVPAKRAVYLPQGRDWFDLWTDTLHPGGTWIEAAAPLARIPVYVASGSIVPLSGSAMQFVDQQPDAPLEIRIFAGMDASFTYYEDAGDTYAYESGAWARVLLEWRNETKRLMLGERSGSFDGMIPSRLLRLVVVTPRGRMTREVTYAGDALEVAFA